MPDTVEGIVRIAHLNNISDVHLGVGEEPRYRSRGDILRTNWPITDPACFRQWLRELLDPGELDVFLRDKEYDTSHTFSFARVRINLLETVNGLGMVLRLIPTEIPSFEKLGLPPVMDNDDPKHVATVNRVLELCRKHKVIAAMHTMSAKYTQRYIDQGFQMVMLTADRIAMSNFVKAEVAKLTGWTPLVPTEAPRRNG